MGIRKHSRTKATGNGKLTRLAEELYPDDGKRWGGEHSHKGLPVNRRAQQARNLALAYYDPQNEL